MASRSSRPNSPPMPRPRSKRSPGRRGSHPVHPHSVAAHEGSRSGDCENCRRGDGAGRSARGLSANARGRVSSGPSTGWLAARPDRVIAVPDHREKEADRPTLPPTSAIGGDEEASATSSIRSGRRWWGPPGRFPPHRPADSSSRSGPTMPNRRSPKPSMVRPRSRPGTHRAEFDPLAAGGLHPIAVRRGPSLCDRLVSRRSSSVPAACWSPPSTFPTWARCRCPSC